MPKTLLRGFLCAEQKNPKAEQVHVFDLWEKRPFTTSINNIMAEHKYNEWRINDAEVATIEPAAGKIESAATPILEMIRSQRRLNRNPQVIYDLALFMAFQFVRTKNIRELPERFERQLTHALEKRGVARAKQEFDKETLKMEHSRHQVLNLEQYANLFVEKEFFLMSAPDGATFYIGDNPVVLHNDERPNGAFGNLGLGVPFIQSFLPISSNLMLCAFSREVLGQWMRDQHERMEKYERDALQRVVSGSMTASYMKHVLDRARAMDIVSPMIDSIRSGEPIAVLRSQVEFCNSLQAFHAHRHVIDQQAHFQVAIDMIGEREGSDAQR